MGKLNVDIWPPYLPPSIFNTCVYPLSLSISSPTPLHLYHSSSDDKCLCNFCKYLVMTNILAKVLQKKKTKQTGSWDDSSMDKTRRERKVRVDEYACQKVRVSFTNVCKLEKGLGHCCPVTVEVENEKPGFFFVYRRRVNSKTIYRRRQKWMCFTSTWEFVRFAPFTGQFERRGNRRVEGQAISYVPQGDQSFISRDGFLVLKQESKLSRTRATFCFSNILGRPISHCLLSVSPGRP